jgi:TPR repeat protein
MNKTQLFFGIGKHYFLKDNKISFYWLRKAAGRGSVGAQYIIGNCYEFGFGVPRNIKLATFWYEKAAKNGSIDANKILSNCYINECDIYFPYIFTY